MLLTPVITTQNACTLAKKVKMSILVSQKPDVMGKNGQQIRIQRPKYTQEQIKLFQIPQKKFFFVAQCYRYLLKLKKWDAKKEINTIIPLNAKIMN